MQQSTQDFDKLIEALDNIHEALESQVRKQFGDRVWELYISRHYKEFRENVEVHVEQLAENSIEDEGNNYDNG